MVAKHLENIKTHIESQLDGTFSVFIIGERGTGKTKLLNTIEEKTFKEVSDVKDFEEKLEETNVSQILILDLIENFTFDEQKKMFKLISTKAENELINVQGKNGEKATCPQLVFTSTKDLKFLYESNDFYTPFIDRIAQQVFILPPLRKLEKNELSKAWENVLINMKFKEKEKLVEYNKSIVDFISRELHLSGNFRDLEKLAIFLWREANKDPELSNGSVEQKQKEFKEIHEIEIKGEFFKTDKPADFMIKEFRKALIDWAEKKYESLSRSELINKLEISEKTYYNWKNGL